MKIIFKDNEHYNLITECDHKDLPIIPNAGDSIWLEGEKYHVVRREFELKKSQQDTSFVIIYVEY